MEKYIVIAIGGSIGAVSRYIVSTLSAKYLGTDFPYGTLIVNIIGSFILSFFMVLSIEKLALNPLWRLFFATGFLGAFTTLSSITYETLAIANDGDYIKALINIFANFFISLLFAYIGFILAKTLL